MQKLCNLCGWFTLILLVLDLLLIAVFSPISLGRPMTVIPWRLNPLPICLAFWFAQTYVCFPLWAVSMMPAIPIFFRRAAGKPVSRLILFYTVAVLISAAITIFLPLYVGLYGWIRTSPTSNVLYGVHEFTGFFAGAAVGSLPLFLLLLICGTDWIQMSKKADSLRSQL